MVWIYKAGDLMFTQSNDVPLLLGLEGYHGKMPSVSCSSVVLTSLQFSSGSFYTVGSFFPCSISLMPGIFQLLGVLTKLQVLHGFGLC